MTNGPDYIIVFGADHIYRMDPSQMVADHIASGAGVTVAGIRQPLSDADQFGVIEVGEDGQGIKAFREKPTDAIGLADAPDEVYASMGNYVFTTDALTEALTKDAGNPASKHDMGGDIIPMLVERNEAAVYDFKDNLVPGSTDRDRGYWRDVGTLDSFYEAHMDLIAIHPVFNLYNYGVAHLHREPAVAAGQVRARLAGAPGQGHRLHGLAGRGHLRLTGGELRRLA